ncbi:exodeoxyribonuclease VII large subunit [Caldimonas tepidiphila]|uniref:exodeoxyribonuclease VII large subunit n=1 Tax=Caldimonas tepidiphila TaxID=2315841 RepID=UPI000E5B9C64|nr:exodeoxyribonuclease VII large subunit [Caldimonas tepidiphila]
MGPLGSRGEAVPGQGRLVWSVSALLQAVADALAARFAACTVRGELSSFTRAPSGHCYFALKDDEAAEPALIRGAMFRRAASLLDFQPREGMLVEVRGRLTVYNARGDLQLVAEAMRPAGQGALFEQFLRLKARLEAEGLFDPGRKRRLPAFPRRLGIVTSLHAAALHDVLTALARRAPHVGVVVYPSLVQGPEAPEALVRALRLAGERAEVDALILCRGGGSLEDLWAFNDERVARAVAACPLPVVCGVGHETDFSICDFVADLRAPTPTAAAELSAPRRDDSLAALGAVAQAMQRGVQRRLDRDAQRLDQLSLRLSRPSQRVQALRGRLSLLEQRLAASVRQRQALAAQRLRQAGERLQRAAPARCREEARRLQALESRLTSVNPARVLQRGYAYLEDPAGRGLSSVKGLQPGQSLVAVLADGRLQATVDAVETPPAPLAPPAEM